MTTSTHTPVPKAAPVFDWPEVDAPRVDDLQQRAAAGAGEPLSVLPINGGLVIRPRQADILPAHAQPLTDRARDVLGLAAGGDCPWRGGGERDGW